MFKAIRITILLIVLLVVGMNAWLTQIRSTDWDTPLFVAIHPISGDNSNKTRQYLDRLEEWHFDDIELFMSTQATRYGVTLYGQSSSQPLSVQLGDRVNNIPPALPSNNSMFSSFIWSLKLRFWHWQMKKDSHLAGADIHLYVIYHDPDLLPVLEHSVGLQKGMVGIVNAYSDRRYTKSNAVVMTHELMHTLGATDKYDPSTGNPTFPDGYAEPDRAPLHPQRYAEIMGGHIPVTGSSSKMPGSLAQTVVGRITAEEINWITSEN
ncbi:hypothetical protein [Endozoicomonas atrinae]|uniref:hypothetical protein n=1 Tax=Endozoicomonas atrinae TaxID=1333660 RepID=UPI003B00B8E6